MFDHPEIPDEFTASMLDRHARKSLQTLPDRLGDLVARHLVAAGQYLDDDPELAYRHALAARDRASRVALVREAVGETAYAAGKFTEALAELRAARRMSGDPAYLPMMADCERALGRPERAVKLAGESDAKRLDDVGQVELAIVLSGARRDMGQAEAAVRLLEHHPLQSRSREPWVARLRYAYADALLDAGRGDEAVRWFHRVVAVDGNGLTDAEERLRVLDPDNVDEPLDG